MVKKELAASVIVDTIIGVMKDAPYERQYEAIADTLVKFGVRSVKQIEDAANARNNPLVPPGVVEKIAPLFIKKMREAEEKAAVAEQKKADDAKQAKLAGMLVKLRAVLDSYTGGTDRGFYSSVAKAALDAGVRDEAELRKVMDLGSDIETFSLFSEDFVGAFNILKDSREVALRGAAAVQQPGMIGVRARGLPEGLLDAARKADAAKHAKKERLLGQIKFLEMERSKIASEQGGQEKVVKLNEKIGQLKAEYLQLTGKTGAHAPRAKGKA